jgi:outer membrane protein assembly factor BamB
MKSREAVKAQRVFLMVSLCAFAVVRPISGGELTGAVQTSRLTGGVILLVGSDIATYDEAAATECTVRGLETDQALVGTLRKRFLARGSYGGISVTMFDGKNLPCIDSLVNLVVTGDECQVPRDEIARVLVPGGVALTLDSQLSTVDSFRKPWPAEMDEWNQYLHDADNNGVATDNAGPPERLQWTGGSKYGRVKVTMPSVTSMVTAGGRIYTVEDVATVESGVLRKQYVLLARDAFNGCELWRRSLKDWDKERCAPVKVIPVQLQRLVLAVDDRVYCTDGYDGPVTVFDGADGSVVARFEDTENTREFAHAEGIIFGIKGAPFAFGVGMNTRAKDVKIEGVTLYARDAASGKLLWQLPIPGGTDGYIGGTLSIKGGHLCYITRTQLHCVDSRTGGKIWARDYPYYADMPRQGVFVLRYHNSPPTIVMTNERIFCAELDRVRAYWVADGSLLWEGVTECNYTKNGDLFYTGGLIWNGYLQGLDPATGEVRRELTQKMTGPMSHDRCYRSRITHQYYINSKSGGTDLVALDGGGEFPGPWMRATCGLSMTPSYGRLYSSPYVCACEIGTMLLGFNCTYNQSRDQGKVMEIEENRQLLKGGAFGIDAGELGPIESDWSTYRHDNARSGVTSSSIPEQLQVVWSTSLPGQPTAPVVADGLVLVAVRNMHVVYALDSETGEQKWHFIADGPVDSPPTCHGRLVLFGSRDGWVYCLDAQSGELVWRFSDLPTVRLMCDSGQLESAWPVNGSVMVQDGLVYFAAGRSSFLDGGIVVYALEPETGKVIYRRVMAGPYDENNFPRPQPQNTHRCEGFKSGIFSSEDGNLYIRHQGFKPDLSPIRPYDIKGSHLIASAGFLRAEPQHRTYWTIDRDLSYGPAKGFDGDGPQGDIIAVDGNTFYEVRGNSPGRHTYGVIDPLKKYRVISGVSRGGPLTANNFGDPARRPSVPKFGQWDRRWTTHIPIAGHAIIVGGETVAVAGVPMRDNFGMDDIEASYEGRKGGLLWTLSAEDGVPTGQLTLPAPPVWDGLAATGGCLYLPLADGTVLCLGAADDRQPPPQSTLPKEWAALLRQSRSKQPAPERPIQPITLYEEDFEDREIGDAERDVVGADKQKGAQVFVTDAATASGKHALAFHDAAGLERAWMPMLQKTLAGKKRWSAGKVTLSFDVLMSEEEPGPLNVMLRDYTMDPWTSAGTISVLPEGVIDVNGKRIPARNGMWHHVVVSFELGSGGNKRISVVITNEEGLNESLVVPFRDREFSTLTWLGISAGGESRSVTYLDNVELRVE